MWMNGGNTLKRFKNILYIIDSDISPDSLNLRTLSGVLVICMFWREKWIE